MEKKMTKNQLFELFLQKLSLDQRYYVLETLLKFPELFPLLLENLKEKQDLFSQKGKDKDIQKEIALIEEKVFEKFKKSV